MASLKLVQQKSIEKNCLKMLYMRRHGYIYMELPIQQEGTKKCTGLYCIWLSMGVSYHLTLGYGNKQYIYLRCSDEGS